MLDSIKRIFAPPVFEDEEKNRIARMLNVVLLAIIFLVGMLTVVRGISGTMFGNSTIINFSLFLVAVILQFIMRRGYVQATSILLITLSWIALTFQAWSADGIRDAAFIAYIVVVLLANLLLGWQAGTIFAGVSILAAWGFAYVEDTGLIQVNADKPYSLALDLTVIFGLSAVAMALTITGLTNALQRATSSERSLVESNRELRTLSESLEQKVATRTHRLGIIAAMTEHLNAILNLDELLNEVVNELKNNFNYYHAQIYLMDKEQEKLVMRAGTGTAGAEMKARGHNISMQAATNLVVRAARTGKPVRIDNVQESPDWLPNLLLPDTYAEIAVPIILDEKVVGVLDIQQDEIAGFDEGDANLLRSLANQVSVAIRNARVFAEVEATLNELREAQQKYVEQAWQKSRISDKVRHLYASPTFAIAEDEQLQLVGETRKLALAQQRPVIVESENDNNGESLVAPINLRDKTIGVLRIRAKDDNQKTWGEEDVAMIEAIVDQVAQTAENLRLFEDTRGRASREQIIRQITEKMRTATNMEELIKTTANELGQQLNAGYVVLDLGLVTDEEK
jgi:GAF domain-containing protein